MCKYVGSRTLFAGTIARMRWARLAALLVATQLAAACGGSTGTVGVSRAPVSGPLGDTWTWNGTVWALHADGTGPSPRFDSAMAFDAGAGAVILFGGQLLLGQLDDTWRWDGKAWTKLRPAHHPDTLSGHLMAYDAVRRQIVLFGGGHGVGERRSGLVDTWVWDGSDWIRRSTEGPRLGGQRMAFDPGSGKVVLFGGSLLNTNYSDATWTWDGARWEQLTPAARPSARYGVGLAFDGSGKRLLLFGGAGPRAAAIGESGLPLSDTWSFGRGSWDPVSPGASPPARANAVMVPAPKGDGVFLFSGTACPYQNDSWQWGGSGWHVARPVGPPSARAYAAAATDERRREVVVFGGLADNPCV